MQRVGIVALAGRLAIGLWHYLQDGQIPVGARLKAAHALRHLRSNACTGETSGSMAERRSLRATLGATRGTSQSPLAYQEIGTGLVPFLPMNSEGAPCLTAPCVLTRELDVNNTQALIARVTPT